MLRGRLKKKNGVFLLRPHFIAALTYSHTRCGVRAGSDESIPDVIVVRVADNAALVLMLSQ